MSDDPLMSARVMIFNVLKELQKEGRKLIVAFLFGFLITIIGLHLYAWEFFESVMRSGMESELSQQVEIIAQTPFEVFLIQAKIGAFVGIACTVPVLMYIGKQRLVSKSDEEKEIPLYAYITTILAGIILFIAGLWYSYFVFFPIVFQFLASATVQTGVEPMYSIAKWTQFMVLLSLSFGLLSQIPVSIPALVRYEIVKYESVVSGLRYWILGTLCLGAILSPPEPISQLLWSVPLIGLYFSAIIISKYINPREKVDKSPEEPDQRPDDSKGTTSDTDDESGSFLPSDPIGSDSYTNYEKIMQIGKELRNNAILLMAIFIVTGIVSFYAQFVGLTESSIQILTGSIPGGEDLNIVALHPVELLMFQAKMSVFAALVPTVLVAMWRIWPNIRRDGVVSISRSNMITYIIVPIITLSLGAVLGALYISPKILEFLIIDAGRINAQISYQVKSFFWIVLYITIVSALSISVYLSMLYWYLRGTSITIFTRYWRQVIFGVLIFSMFITPDSVTKSLIFMFPIVVFFLLGIGTMRVIERFRSIF